MPLLEKFKTGRQEQTTPGVVANTTRTVVGGVRDAAQALHETASPLSRLLDPNALHELGERAAGKPLDTIDLDFGAELPEVPEPTNLPARMVRDLIQFGVGFVPLMKAGQIAFAPATAGGKFITGELAAVAAGQAVISPHEERLSNLIEAYPSLANPITEYLAADPEDTEVESRFKMFLEDLAIGVPFTGVFEGVKAIRHMRRARAKETAEEAAESLIPKPPDEKSLIDLSTNVEQAKRAVHRDVQPQSLDTNLNLERLQTDEQTKQLLGEVSEANDNFAAARRGVQSNEETIKLAETMGMSTDELLKLRKGEALNAEQALAARQKLVASGEKMVELAGKAQGGDEEALFLFRQAMVEHVAIQERVAGITAEAGRTLQQFNIMARSEGAVRTDAIQAVLEQSGGQRNIKAMAKSVAELDTPEAIAKFSRDAMKVRTFDKVYEAWLNGLLSGPQTHAVNILSNSLVSLWSIPEHLLASTFRRGAGVRPQEVTSKLFGMIEGTRDGLRFAGRSFLKGETSDLLTKIESPHDHAIDGVLGSIIRTPTRALQAEDEFFKTVAYRMEINALAMRDGLEKGLKGRQLAEHIDSIRRDPPSDLDASAIDAARYLTFTRPTGVVGQALQNIKKEHPSLGLIVPFIRTPVNIVKFAGERTPFGFFMKQVKADIAKGGAAKDLALSRMALGSAVSGVVATMAMDGIITGSGPTDVDMANIKREADWAPYSVKIGDTWHAYNRLEPIGILFGLTADLVDLGRYLGTDDPEFGEAAIMTWAAISKNLTNKTWLRGLSDLVNASSNPEQFGERWLKSIAGTVVPTALAQTSRVIDPVLRDTQSVVEKIKSRVPGYSASMPARRNVFGEKIVLEGGLGFDIVSPIYTTSSRSNPVAQEMIRLGVDISMPRRQIRRVELTPEQYSEYAEISGKSATEKIRSVMKSPVWRGTPDFAKEKFIRDAFKSSREEAAGLLTGKYPSIVKGIEEQVLN